MDFETPQAPSNGRPLAYDRREQGRQRIDAIARQIKHATLMWDYSEKPRYYRLTVSQGDMKVTMQFDGETLANHSSPEFRDICDRLLRRLPQMFVRS